MPSSSFAGDTQLKVWGKIKIEDTINRDITLEAINFKAGLDAVCTAFDLSKPIICAKHLSEIEAFSRTVFYTDDFVDTVFFDTLEIEIIGDKK